MTREEFLEVLDGELESIRRISGKKGNDYIQGTDDEFRNFRVHAEELGLTKEQVWAVYASKHWDAIISFCKGASSESEPIEGRLHDMILYCLLMLGMVREDRAAREKAAAENGGLPPGQMRVRNARWTKNGPWADVLRQATGKTVDTDALKKRFADAGWDGEFVLEGEDLTFKVAV